MTNQVTRRKFLKAAGTGSVAMGAVSAFGADGALPPTPDAQTKATVDGKAAEGECCTAAPTLIFACSGAADVGKIADLAARQLNEKGAGKMSCLAGVGGRVKVLMDVTKAAQTILVIDGCPLQCGRNTLEQAGFRKFEHVRLSDLGMEKGKTPATPEHVEKVAEQARMRLTG